MTLLTERNYRADSHFGTGKAVTKPAKHRKVVDITFQNNEQSDYTEQIEAMERAFRYADYQHCYWTEPEQSLLYGTPLYEQATDDQKRALNHLYWVIQNNNTAASEVNTIIYNQVTAGVFESLSGYDQLCEELTLETNQEYHHIHAFQKVGHRTRTALLGRKGFGWTGKENKEPQTNRISNWLAKSQDTVLQFLAKHMLKPGEYLVSQYLQELETQGKFAPTPTQGSGGRAASPTVLKFFTSNWGSSPFLACQYYTMRYVSNGLLKSQEHPRSRYFKKLQKAGEEIPIPTAISHYHFLDESFHTTISLTVGRDMYRDFAQPTMYERAIANWAVYLAQRNIIRYHSGLSTGLPARCFRSDVSFMEFIYRLLQSPVFELSPQESLHWMERSFCAEHEGFHVAKRYQKGFVTDFRQFFGQIDYLWPINREMRLIDLENTVDAGLNRSRAAFKSFSNSLALCQS